MVRENRSMEKSVTGHCALSGPVGVLLFQNFVVVRTPCACSERVFFVHSNVPLFFVYIVQKVEWELNHLSNES